MTEGKQAALVTGAARGIGKAIAVRLARDGMNVAICDLLRDAMSETKNELEKMGSDTLTFSCDVCDSAKVAGMVTDIEAHYGRLDVLVNNAGITADKLLMRMSDDDWAKVMAVNLTSVFNCTRSVVRGMISRRKGRIISISSVIGLMGNVGQANYAASKAGIIGFSKSVAKEVAARGVTVNVVAPGYIDTPMTRDLPEKAKQQLFDMIPMRRLGTPEDVANIVAYLASDDAGYMTGQVINVNGGLYM
ncbi:MAG: 3-oxoacyl-[acyl-carrier-protein] reductase [Candidatus Coatesbacteria bacterium]|nr:3-oxoacyl-[acyl-carrier-protein] reductase [Candidatus Coatesbacteria bacterium]